MRYCATRSSLLKLAKRPQNSLNIATMDANLTPLITAAKQQAALVLEENFVSEPPVLVEGIAKNYGLQVKVADLGSSGNDVAGFIDPATKTIYVNKDDSPAR